MRAAVGGEYFLQRHQRDVPVCSSGTTSGPTGDNIEASQASTCNPLLRSTIPSQARLLVHDLFRFGCAGTLLRGALPTCKPVRVCNQAMYLFQ